MKTWVLLLLVVFCIGISFGVAQTPAPKPGPEIKKLAAQVGDWSYEGNIKESPLGPAGKYSGKYSCRWALVGYFLEYRGEEKNPLGMLKWFEMDGYDPVNKKYTTYSAASDGSQSTGSFTVEGRQWVCLVDGIQAGKQFKERQTLDFSSDGLSYTWKCEISMDGKSWSLLAEDKATKTPPAAKPAKPATEGAK